MAIPQDSIDGKARPVGQAIWRGARGRCPHCAEGRLFRTWLKPVDRCATCGEDFTHQRADDFPAYLNILVTGHVAVAVLMIFLEVDWITPLQLTLASIVAAVAAALAAMRPLKGAVIGAQWAMRMHGFGGRDD